VPDLGTMEQQKDSMAREHGGKIRGWFPSAEWRLIELDSASDRETLVCLASEWTRNSGLLRNENSVNNRILSTFVRHAVENNYFGEFERPILHGENSQKRQIYIQRLRDDPTIRFEDDNRVVLCSLTSGERASNSSGTFYLHDGLGRMLAYGYLIAMKHRAFRAVEAFAAIEPKPLI